MKKSKGKIRGFDQGALVSSAKRGAMVFGGYLAGEYLTKMVTDGETEGEGSNRGLVGGGLLAVGVGVPAMVESVGQSEMLAPLFVGMAVSGLKNVAQAMAGDTMKTHFGIGEIENYPYMPLPYVGGYEEEMEGNEPPPAMV